MSETKYTNVKFFSPNHPGTELEVKCLIPINAVSDFKYFCTIAGYFLFNNIGFSQNITSDSDGVQPDTREISVNAHAAVKFAGMLDAVSKPCNTCPHRVKTK